MTKFDRDIHDELTAHIEHRADDLVRSGLPREEALRRARIEFGSYEAYKEQLRDERRLAGMRRIPEALCSDARVALRRLRASPLFTLTSALTLGLGLGLNGTVFAVVDGMLLRPLPYGDPDRIVVLTAPRVSGPPWVPGAAVLAAAGSTAVSGVAQVFEQGTLTPLDTDESLWRYTTVSEETLDVLQVRPQLGRGFHGGDGNRAPVRAGLISDGAWRQRFGGDESVIGRVVRFDGESIEIVGVMPRAFFLPSQYSLGRGIDLVIADEPLVAGTRDDFVHLLPFVRLSDGRSPEELQNALDAHLAPFWARQPPDSRVRVQAASMRQVLFASWRPMLSTLALAVGLILSLAVVNVLLLLVAQGLSRAREFAMRAALGASRWQIARQVGVETALLTVLGGALALLLYAGAHRLLPDLLPPALAAFLPGPLDLRPLAALWLLAVASSVLLTAFLSTLATRTDLRMALGQDRMGMVATVSRWGRPLVGIQSAIAVLVLIGTAAAVSGFARLARQPLGYDSANLSAASVTPSDVDSSTSPSLSAALASLRSRYVDQRFEASDCALFNSHCGSLRAVTAGWFDLLNVRILRGRAFSAHEERARARVAVVTASYARLHWPGATALGRLLADEDGSTFEVIGVADDLRPRRDTYAVPLAFIPWAGRDRGSMTVFTRGVESDRLVTRLAAEVRPRLTKARVGALSMEDRALITPTMLTSLFAVFGFSALLVTSIGVLALQSASVAARRNEIAIRMAIGGTQTVVSRQIVGRAMRPLIAGTTTGLLAAWWGAPILDLLLATASSELARGSAAHVPAAAAAVALFTAVAVVAAWLPARRAASVDPNVALKEL